MAWVVSDETIEDLRRAVAKGNDTNTACVAIALVGETERVLASLVWTTEDWAWQVEGWESYEHELTDEQRAEVLKRLNDEWGDFEHEYVVEQVNEQLQEIVSEVVKEVLDGPG